LTDLTCHGSYWKKFHQELTSHHNKQDKILEKVFQILQNIQDRLTLQKHVRLPRDPISLKTVNEKPDETKKKSESWEGNKVMDILQMGPQFK
jgi:hypothetical protein